MHYLSEYYTIMDNIYIFFVFATHVDLIPVYHEPDQLLKGQNTNFAGSNFIYFVYR